VYKPGASGGVPPANGYFGYTDADSTLAIYYSSAWHPLAWRSDIVWENDNGVYKTRDDSFFEDIVFSSSQLDDRDSLTFGDTRMFFDGSKSAFYANRWDGAQVDDANRGLYSANFSNNSTTSGPWTAAVGGRENVVTFGVALSCDFCESDGRSSVAMGYKAKTELSHEVVQGSGNSSTSAGHHQYRRIVAMDEFEGAGNASIVIDGLLGSSFTRLTIPDSTMWAGTCNCAAIVKTASTAPGTSVGDHKYYEGRFTAKNLSSTVTVQFIDDTNAAFDSASFASSALSLTADTFNDALSVQITSIPGDSDSVTRITCTLEITETSYK